MKRIIFSVAIILAASFSMKAQNIKFGIKGGLNLTNWSGDAVNTDVRTGFHAGGLAEFKWGNFALQPELLFNTAGVKTDTEMEGFPVELTAKMSYISIPVAAKYFIIEGLSIQAGPQFSFLVAAKDKYKGGGDSIEIDAKDNYKTFDLGLFGGLGYELNSGFLVSARYIQGLSNINDIAGYNEFTLNNTNIQISVGYKF